MSGHEQCSGCFRRDRSHNRAYWGMCDTCVQVFDALKVEAKGKILLARYTPDAHLWRISGQVNGDTSEGDMGSSAPFAITKPILVEHVCQWCAIHNALMTIDPWAFEYLLGKHGDDQTHNTRDMKDSLWWMGSIPTDDGITVPSQLIIEDLGIIGEDRWGRRLNRPKLIGRRV